MKVRKLFKLILFILVFTFVLNEIVLSQSKYDTDLVITVYDIHLSPDFEKNIVNATVIVNIQNLSLNPINKAEIMFCTFIDTEDLEAEVQHIFWIEKGRKDSMNFSVKKEKNPFNPKANISLYELFFKKPLEPEEKVKLEFVYKIKGKSTKSSFPLCKGEIKELYLISDFRWLPQIFAVPKIGQFNNIYKPAWVLRVEYPSTYVAVADGELVRKSELNGNSVEEWKSIIRGFPQILIGQYEIIKKKKGEFTIEIYTPKDEEIKKAISLLSDDIIKILQIYFDIYGHSGSTTYRLVASYTNWGGHGLYMGQVIDKNYLKS